MARAEKLGPHRLMSSGLYEVLLRDGLLASHEELPGPAPEGVQGILRPEPVPFVSYPHEWCFGQLRAAALAALAIQRRALESGLSLSRASARDFQFVRGRAALTDALAFEPYEEGRPWAAHEGFLRHFLTPLALMRHVDARLSGLSRIHPDGVPLDLGLRLLPASLPLRNVRLWLQLRFAPPALPGLPALRRLIDRLAATVEDLSPDPELFAGRECCDVRGDYSARAWEAKTAVVESWLRAAAPRRAWDLGANAGYFSRLASRLGAFTVALDGDAALVEGLYLWATRERDVNLLPLRVDPAHPSPSLSRRGPADVVLALAVVPHLVIERGVAFDALARRLAGLGREAVVEFAPAEDARAAGLLRRHPDRAAGYAEGAFEAALAERFSILERAGLPESRQRLYRLASKEPPARGL